MLDLAKTEQVYKGLSLQSFAKIGPEELTKTKLPMSQ